MARHWNSHFRFFPTDPKTGEYLEDESYGWGGSEEFRYDGEWVTDEMLRDRANREADYIFKQYVKMRDMEIELDRKAAEPFWKRWLG